MFSISASYITMSMIITALSLLATVLTLGVYHHSPNTPVPKWIRVVAFNFTGTLFFCGKKKSWLKNPKGNNTNAVHDIKVIELDKDQKDIATTALPPEATKLCSEYLRKYKEDKEVEQNREDWQRVARVLDRFFFVVFVLAITIMTIHAFATLRVK